MEKLPNPEDSARARLAWEIIKHRKDRGLSQGGLAKLLQCSPSKISAMELMNRGVDDQTAADLDRAFGLDGYFLELARAVRFDAVTPPHYRDFRAAEEKADEVHTWDPLLIPGLFQTQAYARHVFEDEPGITSEEVEKRVQARMRRQSLLTGPNPPLITSLIDEGVLHRPLGGAAVMREQLERLLDLANIPGITIQVVPYESWSAVGCLGAFSVALTRMRATTVYVECRRILKADPLGYFES
ncbi:helix-turn-helix transcriptional regulator [Thermopolyspora sp. NPDC052614]|uniref:helix-turn-helix domain-containing protein n=1 Tax=Thermopolyspora sp. NPDC052614 TaxID=3155682 RepID=UPI003441DE74